MGIGLLTLGLFLLISGLAFPESLSVREVALVFSGGLILLAIDSLFIRPIERRRTESILALLKRGVTKEVVRQVRAEMAPVHDSMTELGVKVEQATKTQAEMFELLKKESERAMSRELSRALESTSQMNSETIRIPREYLEARANLLFVRPRQGWWWTIASFAVVLAILFYGLSVVFPRFYGGTPWLIGLVVSSGTALGGILVLFNRSSRRDRPTRFLD